MAAGLIGRQGKQLRAREVRPRRVRDATGGCDGGAAMVAPRDFAVPSEARDYQSGVRLGIEAREVENAENQCGGGAVMAALREVAFPWGETDYESCVRLGFGAREVENAANHCGDGAMMVASGDVALPPLEETDCESCVRLGLGGRRHGGLGLCDSFPAGFKFDPSDEELLQHLRAEIGLGDMVSHPRIGEFIPELKGEDGICQTHPEFLPGVKKDGSSRHFFHRPTRAYTTGNRKRRKIHCESDAPGVDTRWHKTGKTRAVLDGGSVLGWKKIMVLYRSSGTKKSKAEKTNWILHQYHVGHNEEETDGQLVVCKVFYQRQPRQCTGGRQPDSEMNGGNMDICFPCVSEVSGGTPWTPKANPERVPRPKRQSSEQGVSAGSGGMSATVTRSSKQSGLTVADLDRRGLMCSEMTSVPMTQENKAWVPDVRAPDFCNREMGGSQSEAVHQTVMGEFSSGWDYATYEEVSTSVVSPHDESRHQEAIAGQDGDDCPAPAFLPGGSQLQYQGEDTILHCHEELGGVDLFSCELGYLYENGGLEEPCITDPNADYPPVGQFATDTPPAFNMDLILSSQEVMDVIYAGSEAKVFLSAETFDNDDSLSSC